MIGTLSWTRIGFLHPSTDWLLESKARFLILFRPVVFLLRWTNESWSASWSVSWLRPAGSQVLKGLLLALLEKRIDASSKISLSDQRGRREDPGSDRRLVYHQEDPRWQQVILPRNQRGSIRREHHCRRDQDPQVEQQRARFAVGW